jgi:AcrR family transcriptional regulator
MNVMPAAARAKKLPRLDKRAWIAAAFAELAAHGWDGVRVEPIAATLSVTKGSFYWHFTDRDALIAAMFIRWAEGRVRAIRHETEDDQDPRALLYRLIDLYARGPHAQGLAIELAIRGVARSDSRAADAVAMVDGERLAQVSRLFSKLGSKPAQSEARAFLFYAFVFGQSLIAGRRDASLRAAASELIVE